MEIGTDIVALERIEKIFNKYGDNFLKKILTLKEIKILNSINNKKRKIEKIAGIFAAKEAVIKCLSKRIPFNKISILYSNQGKPYCIHDNFIIKISISHEKEYAIAMAILEKK